MRRLHQLIVIGFLATGLLVGCELSPLQAPYDEAASSPAVVEETDDVTASAQAYADRLAIARRPASRVIAPVANKVMWLDPTSQTPQVAATITLASSPAVLPSPQPSVVRPDDVSLAETPVHASGATRLQLVTRMLDDIRTTDDPALAKALDAVAVSLIDPHHDLDFRFISPLSPSQQESVQSYHRLLTLLHEQLRRGGEPLDREALTEPFEQLFGREPVGIKNMTLCRRVMGYGVYEPFESTTFLGGRTHKMIVYVELDHFKSVARGEEQFAVDLKQEVTLYSSDGLAVWRNEAVSVSDVSRNQRRDFFVVQLITLPERLGVGKYRLKIRVTDLNGGSIDEQGIDLNFVAEQSLVRDEPNQNELRPLRRR